MSYRNSAKPTLTLALTNNSSFAKAEADKKKVFLVVITSHMTPWRSESQMTVPDLIPSKTEIRTGVNSFMRHHNIS